MEATPSSDTPTYFVTPLDELKHLKNLVRTGKLVPPSTATVSAPISAITEAAHSRPRSGSGTGTSRSSTGSGSLDSSMSMNASRSNVSMSAGGVDSQKMNQRLKEVFREKIGEYREAVYLLFGYKVSHTTIFALKLFIRLICQKTTTWHGIQVDLMPADSITGEPGSSMLKLRSMYAESPDDCLKFIQVIDTYNARSNKLIFLLLISKYINSFNVTNYVTTHSERIVTVWKYWKHLSPQVSMTPLCFR